MVPLALGSQTAGSIIRPASYCGVFGLKPTFGFLDMRGAKPFAPSLDTVGWFARTANDLELMRCALAGLPFEPLEAVAPAGLKLIASRTAQWNGTGASGRAAWEQAGQRCLQAGIALRRAELDTTLEGLFDAQKVVMTFEAARSFAPEWRDHPGALSDVLKQLLSTGQGISQETYDQAQALARQARTQVLQWMGDADAVLTLSATGEAPAGLSATGDPMFNRIWSLLGFPCVNVPGLLGPSGLPVGLQLVGRPGAERPLLVVAQALHRVITQAAPGA
jgi:Asp-tRNA(Asn)/Glu-tRNA(Gln) amidotransferase A subunit family amidase